MNRDIKIKSIAFCVLAIALAVSWPARANTIFLTCGSNSFTVDLTNHTVNNLPASITSTAIDWQKTSYPEPGGSAVSYSHIDRIAGTYMTYFTAHFPNGVTNDSPRDTHPCTAGSAPATKF
jgi:hypothetical protein